MSIPTSLIVVILVAAWLAVLVPMVARRREQVPEAEADGGTFRVLRRASASVRRRPRLGRQDELEEDELVDIDDRDPLEGAEALDEELLDDDEAFDDELDTDEFDDEPEEDEPVRVRGRRARTLRSKGGVETVAFMETAVIETQGHETDFYPAETTDYQAEPEYTTDARQYDADRHYPEARQGDDPHLRPVPRRSGRGGYDPDAAEIARAYRYSRRRRVTVVLLVATIVFSLAAYFVKPILWSGTAVFGLLLIAYLGYLRRQVHIEADIRERRLARLARARQIRPEYPMAHSEMPIAAAPFTATASQVPPSGYRSGRQIVDLEDDDPSFDDLEYYQPISYRRASGQ